MKSLTTKMMIAAAALVAAAEVASAQTMEAKVPFPFRANGKTYAAGTYRISTKGTTVIPMIVLSSQDTGERSFALPAGNTDPKKDWKATGDPVLSFECGVGRCSLSELWIGSSEPAYRLSVPKLGKDEPRRTAEIVMHPVTD